MKNTERISRLMARLCEEQFEREGTPWGCDNAWRGRCYAAALTLQHAAFTMGIHLKLVHGVVSGIVHAWCEDSRHVYDMTHFDEGGTYPQADYYLMFKARSTHHYNYLEGYKGAVVHEQYGPWAVELLEMVAVENDCDVNSLTRGCPT